MGDLAGSASGESAQDDIICFKQRQGHCTRYTIEFTGTPGDLATLSVKLDKVTVGSKTTAQDSTTNIGATSSDQVSLAVDDSTGGVEATHSLASSVQHTCTSPTVSGKTIVCTDQDFTIFGTTEQVKIECLVSGSTYKSLGYYTVSASSAPVTLTLTLEETAPAC